MKQRVMFSRTYEVVIDCADDALIEHVRDRAVDKIIRGDADVNVGRLEFDGLGLADEEDA
jgi:hypothetical protein